MSPLLDTINNFLMITMPGDVAYDLKDATRNGLEALEFEEKMRSQLLEVELFQRELTTVLAAEFITLTNPATSSFISKIKACCGYRLRQF